MKGRVKLFNLDEAIRRASRGGTIIESTACTKVRQAVKEMGERLETEEDARLEAELHQRRREEERLREADIRQAEERQQEEEQERLGKLEAINRDQQQNKKAKTDTHAMQFIPLDKPLPDPVLSTDIMQRRPVSDFKQDTGRFRTPRRSSATKGDDSEVIFLPTRPQMLDKEKPLPAKRRSAKQGNWNSKVNAKGEAITGRASAKVLEQDKSEHEAPPRKRTGGSAMTELELVGEQESDELTKAKSVLRTHVLKMAQLELVAMETRYLIQSLLAKMPY